jgi:hypothetical protein
VNLQCENTVRDDVHDDRLGESLGLALENRLQWGINQRLGVSLRRKSGRVLLASISRESLILGMSRARSGSGRKILNVVLSIEKSLLLRRAISSVAPGDTTEPAGDVVSNFSSTISLVLLLGMGLIKEEKSDNDTKENGGGAEKVREEVRVSIPDGSTSKDLGVADAWSSESSSNHRPNDRSKEVTQSAFAINDYMHYISLPNAPHHGHDSISTCCRSVRANRFQWFGSTYADVP